MGTVDFPGRKMKLIASIVAISAIALGAGMRLSKGEAIEDQALIWMVVIHVTFVLSGVLLALIDWLASKVENHQVVNVCVPLGWRQ